MKVQLIVVRGKPEGKIIPLAGPKFRIGRGETCHLRPNSEQVSREHAEFTVVDGVVTVADLGSRNGTLVNGKPLTAPCVLKDGMLVQVGPLTFAVHILDAPAARAASAPPAAPASASPAAPAGKAPSKPPTSAAAKSPTPPAKAPTRSAPEDVLNEDIDAWLVGEGSGDEAPTSVYGGETITIAAFKDGVEHEAAPAPVEEEEEEEAEDEEETVEDSLEESDDEESEDEGSEDEGAPVDEFIDESNPFYAAKKAQKDAEKASKSGSTKTTGGANQQFKDTSDAASEILKRLMEKRRASK